MPIEPKPMMTTAPSMRAWTGWLGAMRPRGAVWTMMGPSLHGSRGFGNEKTRRRWLRRVRNLGRKGCYQPFLA